MYRIRPLAAPSASAMVQKQTSGLLVARFRARASLGQAERGCMLALMRLCYDGVEAQRFFVDLDAKQWVIVLYSRQRRQLVGFSTLRIVPESCQGRRVEVIFSGDTVIHPAYWGQKTLQAAFGRFILRRKLSHPFRPCLWLLLSKGLKTYLLMVHHFPRSFPQRGVVAPPAYQALRDRLASAWWGNAYDAERGLVHFSPPRDAIKPALLGMDPDPAAQPAAAFFFEHNPGHAQGDELVCLAELRLTDVFRALLRIGRQRGWRVVRRVWRGSL